MPAVLGVEGDVVVVRPTKGTWDVTDLKAMQDLVAERLRQLGLRRVLVDVRKTRALLSTAEIYYLHPRFRELFAVDTRHAIVVDEATTEPENVEFAENVARNRGIILRMFHDEATARAWLAG